MAKKLLDPVWIALSFFLIPKLKKRAGKDFESISFLYNKETKSSETEVIVGGKILNTEGKSFDLISELLNEEKSGVVLDMADRNFSGWVSIGGIFSAKDKGCSLVFYDANGNNLGSLNYGSYS